MKVDVCINKEEAKELVKELFGCYMTDPKPFEKKTFMGNTSLIRNIYYTDDWLIKQRVTNSRSEFYYIINGPLNGLMYVFDYDEIVNEGEYL